ncbi:MAG: hypothetical protein KDD69_14615 [Bdellovibrionales bacterium]|nr:hypothetical protein [Bdellovibrionales bacterium]
MKEVFAKLVAEAGSVSVSDATLEVLFGLLALGVALLFVMVAFRFLVQLLFATVKLGVLGGVLFALIHFTPLGTKPEADSVFSDAGRAVVYSTERLKRHLRAQGFSAASAESPAEPNLEPVAAAPAVQFFAAQLPTQPS